MADDHFELDASPEALDYLSKIATEMQLLFLMSREEAVGRINQLWAGRFQLRTDSQLSLFFRENVEYWAKQVYYRDDTHWWKEGELLIPRDYP